ALWLAETYLRQGNRAEARSLIDDVLATSREIGYRYLAGVAVRLLGESLVATEPEAARRHLDAARQMLEDVDAPNDRAKALAVGGGGMKAGGTGVGVGMRRARRIDSSISGVMRFICSVTRAASTAVPTTRGVTRSSSSVFSIFSSVAPKR